MGGSRIIRRVHELLELSVTPLPANARTFTHSAKSAGRRIPTVSELHDLERESLAGLEDHPDVLRQQMYVEMRAALAGEG